MTERIALFLAKILPKMEVPSSSSAVAIPTKYLDELLFQLDDANKLLKELAHAHEASEDRGPNNAQEYLDLWDVE